MRNLTSKQTREMFRRLNKNVKVSDGQLYSMSEEDSPLVREALALLNDDDYPLRTRITDYFFDTRNNDNDGKKQLENAVALVSGAIYGPEYITKSFTRQEENVENQSEINRTRVVTILGYAFEVFRQANDVVELTDKRKTKSYFTVGNYLGVILYDILMNLNNVQQVQRKWCNYLVKVRNEETDAVEAINVSGAKNITVDLLKRKSVKVETYLNEKRIMSTEELNKVRHPLPVDTDSEYYDSEEDVNDN